MDDNGAGVLTFLPPACLCLTLAAQAGTIQCSVLNQHAGALWQAVWQGDGTDELRASALAQQARSESHAPLTVAQAAAVERQLAQIDPWTLADSDHTARDGVQLRCDCQHQQTRHTFAMGSPTFRDAPPHAALCHLFITTAQAHLTASAIHAYLAGLARSFDIPPSAS